ncbi:MAG: MATE family efflux transporter [Peptostreptococcaceae bacterium]|nr:MATE family efflux transporter [Peptostreptococcaceae bacterium]MDY5739519.1 MATE family efflux transporter [Anaerovoracaceae bacterium]
MQFYNFLRRLFSIEYLLPKIGEESGCGEVPSTKEAYKHYLDVAWPAAMQGLLIDLMMAIDLAMVGVLGANALASVGIIGQPKMVMLVLARALSVPITAMVARRKGEGMIEDMNAVLKQGILLTIICYIPILITAFSFISEIVSFSGGKGALIQSGAAYGKYIVIGVFFSALTQIIGAALIGIGNTKVVFKANVIGNLVNTGLNAFLIYGWLFFPRFGVVGAGIATMCGNIVTAIIIFGAVTNGSSQLNLKSKASWVFSKKTVNGFLKIGGSALGEQSFERFGMFAYTKMVAGLGVVQLATHHVCMNLCDIFYSFSLGLGYAGASHTGQWLGKDRSDMAEAYGRIGIRIGLCLAALACLVYVVARYPLIDVYTNDERVIALGSKIIIIMALASFPQIMQLVFAGVLKGAGDSFYVMLYSLFVIAIFRPILTYILCFVLNMGLYGAWLALIIDQSLRMIFSGLRFRSGKWKAIKL